MNGNRQTTRLSRILIVLLAGITASGCWAGRLRQLEAERAAQEAELVELRQRLAALRAVEDSLHVTTQAATAYFEQYERQFRAFEEAMAEVRVANAVVGAAWEPVTFDVDESEVSGDARNLLDTYIERLEASPQVGVALIGRADPRGDEDYNLSLSAERAESVREYLESNGVKPWRISVVAAGEHSPVVAAADEAAVAVNRSVTAVVQPFGEPITIESKPPGAAVFMFEVGDQWARALRRLDDPAFLSRYRVDDPTNTRVHGGRTWFNFMYVYADGRRFFDCGVKVTHGGDNRSSVDTTLFPNTTPCR